MNRSALIVTLLIVAVVAGGIWIYDRYFNQPEGSIWDLVPQSSSLVYEPQSGMEIIGNLEESEIWKSLTSMETFSFIPTNLGNLDSLADREAINSMITNGGLLVAAGPVSGTDFDFLYIIDKKRNPELITQFVARLSGSSTKKRTDRLYNGYTISEIPTSERDFSFASNEDYWWGSYSSFLTEDVIRLLTEEGNASFQSTNPEPFFNTKISQDAGNLYFNYKELGTLLNSFLAPQSRALSTKLAGTGKSAFLDVDVKNDQVLMTGFSYYREGDFLSEFEGKLSGSSNIRLYVPSQTAFYINYFSESFDKLADDGQLSEISSTLNGEVAVVTLEGQELKEAEQIAFIRSDEPSKTAQLLRQYATSLAEASGDTLYFEEFSDRDIIELKKPGFISDLTPYFNSPSDQCFYTFQNNLFYFSPSIQVLKNLLLDIETENTWGKSVKKNSFYDNTLQESSFSVYLDINRSWNFIIDNLHPLWGDHFESNAATYRNFDLLAIQYSYTDKKYFTNLVMSYSADNSSIFTRRKRLDPDFSAEFASPVYTRPKVVRNHTGPEREIILQDQGNTLYLIAPSRGILWSYDLSSKIKDDIIQVDYYKNGKLQYAFATDSAIHILDRNGNNIEGFPRKFNYVIDHFNVIDYDNSKRYRLVTSDIRGNVYLYDKEGKSLEGWRPRALQGRLARAPYHFRVRGRDIIVAVQEKGVVNLMNRRGEMMPGFPVDLGPDLRPVFHTELGSSFGSTILTFITSDGLISRYDLNGKKLSSQQVFRSSRNVVFDIVPEYTGKGYVIVSKDIATFQVLDKNTNEIFRGNIITTRPFNYQYYDFGSDRKLYVITDPEQEFSYLYDRYGNLINNSPINSKFDIAVLFSEVNNQYKIYTAYEDKVSIYSF